MKKFVKYTALTALVLTILGIVLFTIGAIGGSVQGIKTLDVLAEKFKAGEFSIDSEDIERLAEVLDTTGADVKDILRELDDMGVDLEEWFYDLGIEPQFSINEDNIHFNNAYRIYEGGSQNFTVEGTDAVRINISLTGSEITFKESSDGDFHIQATGIGRLQAYVEDHTFYLKGSKTGLNITLSDIVLEIPEGVSFENLTLDVGAGSVDIDSIKVEKLKVDVGAGVFTANYLDTDEARFSVGAGEIAVRDGNIRYLKADVGAGSIDVEGYITGDIDADVALGELDILVKGSEEKDHNYKVDCAMGELQVGSYFWAGVSSSDVHIDNNASSTYDLDCAMGSLIVTFKE